MTIDEFVQTVSELETRLNEDPIVSADIQKLGSAVRVLAEGLKDSQEVIAELQGALVETQDALIEVKKRPTYNINYHR